MVDRTDRRWHYATGLGELSLCKIEPYQATQWIEDVTCPVCIGMMALQSAKKSILQRQVGQK